MKISIWSRLQDLSYLVVVFLVISTLISFLFLKKARADEFITLYPVADAEIYSGTENTNYGSYSIIEVGHSTLNGHYRFAYLKFDISGVPQNATITGAWLTVYKTQCDGDTVNISAKQISADWTESTITWKNAPDPIESGAGVTTVDCNSYEGFAFDITQIVQNWRSGQSNYGVGLFSESTISYLRTFNSREYGGLDFQPQVQIDYTLPVVVDPEQTTDPNQPAAPDDSDPSNPNGETPTGSQPTEEQPAGSIPTTDIEDIDDLIATLSSEDWQSFPIFSPFVESLGFSFLPCLLLLCCCCLLFLIILVIIMLSRRAGNSKKEQANLNSESKQPVSETKPIETTQETKVEPKNRETESEVKTSEQSETKGADNT